MIILLIYENIIAYVLNNIIQLIVFTAFLLKSHITFHKNELQFNIYIWTLLIIHMLRMEAIYMVYV